jgi:hypothetical protein
VIFPKTAQRVTAIHYSDTQIRKQVSSDVQVRVSFCGINSPGLNEPGLRPPVEILLRVRVPLVINWVNTKLPEAGVVKESPGGRIILPRVPFRGTCWAGEEPQNAANNVPAVAANVNRFITFVSCCG